MMHEEGDFDMTSKTRNIVHVHNTCICGFIN